MFNSDYLKKTNIRFFREHNKKVDYVNLNGNIIILSDRLYFLGIELFSYMQNNSNANLIKLISSSSDINSTDYKNIDYLIIVGYLDNLKNYDLVNTLRKQNNNIKTVQWAVLDEYIDHLCLEYEISFKFCRVKSVNEFMNYLCEIKDQHDVKYKPDTEYINSSLPVTNQTNIKNLITRFINYLKSFNI